MQAPKQEIVPLEQRDKKDLLKYIEGLDALLSTNHIISSTFDLQTIIRVIANQATQFLRAEGMYVFGRERHDLKLIYSTLADHDIRFTMVEDGLLSQVVRRGRPVNLSGEWGEDDYLIEFGLEKVEGVNSLLCAALSSQDEILGVALVLNKKDGEDFSREDAVLFETYCGQMASAIRNFEHLAQEMEQQRLEREIEFCAKIQRRILPKRVPEVPGYGISGSTYPCRKVGGDWFNFFKRPNGDIDFTIADVSGKGIAAALVVAMAHSALQVLSRSEQPLDELIGDLNRFICDSVELGQFITLFYGRLEPESGRFTYVNAGHDAPMLFEPGETEPHYLESTGKIIGVDPNSEYYTGSVTIQTGATLIMLTDGIVETTNSYNEFFGDVFFEKIRPENFGPLVKPIRRRIYDELNKWRGTAEPKDDATLLVITRPEAGESH